ncbi:unnamed protein product [Somion occarium]|uniref:RRM domain-containing protein n=1 Tax=Somion occarium TaxID=3059160 RepID=A0ABP1D5Q7_9APHY
MARFCAPGNPHYVSATMFQTTRKASSKHKANSMHKAKQITNEQQRLQEKRRKCRKNFKGPTYAYVGNLTPRVTSLEVEKVFKRHTVSSVDIRCGGCIPIFIRDGSELPKGSVKPRLWSEDWQVINQFSKPPYDTCA